MAMPAVIPHMTLGRMMYLMLLVGLLTMVWSIATSGDPWTILNSPPSPVVAAPLGIIFLILPVVFVLKFSLEQAALDSKFQRMEDRRGSAVYKPSATAGISLPEPGPKDRAAKKGD
mmetsp:Transcript_30270/g.85367  ORF Transcript_30270/g.85367 Transcript_30270/m.85367 type:complete len:116 (-) Transcript_30270:165-512(-)|eukprot:CAMPEP_0179360572 /NCGR_PEP_ID=MMETSP0797-20121207/80050_1 /TAXON_ID=47934 /ORGANISM="Dinophysis acuminata, Strain DAEP01" /LENGTH=115 /DNA_ID=CAMNT_0021075939 /DNA_START=57 /DNA_END=404 /DNA_ORIENTATION=+